MERNDFLDGWVKLRGVYPRLPNLEDQSGKTGRIVADAWFEPVRKFRREVWLDAVENCILHERFAPVPVTLRSYCFAASQRLQEEELERRRAMAPDEECAWCGGSGWIFVEPENEWPSCFACSCAHSRDPETGRRILDKALADETWQFCQEDHTFRPRDTWIGDVTPEQEAMIETAFAEGRVSTLV